MSSDDYFDDDCLDDAAFEQLDAIEAAHTQKQPATLPDSDPPFDVDDFSFGDIDERELQRLDTFIEDSYQGKAQPVAGPSKTRQTTLFGDVLPPAAPLQRTKSASRNPFGHQPAKTKQWDHTEFAKTGLKRSNGKRKEAEDNEEDGGPVEFEQFPAPFVSLGYVEFYYARPPPMKLRPDLLEAKHWIYPLNHPKRDYQYNIVKHCLFENAIVALPTGLGKTFVAGVVMLNYYRWFPEGKVVFVAPTKPLVAQQIEASHKTCGIPGSDAIELTGEIPVATRERAWREKRVFYMTPQTLINDLVKETCDVKDIILLVVDEAHRATGDYAYNQVVRFMMAKNPHFRILALTATPGGKPDAVQALVDGLHISRIEIRDENSLDITPYIHHKKIEQHIIRMSEEVNRVKDPLVKLMNSLLKPLESSRVLQRPMNPITIHPFFASNLASTLKDNWSARNALTAVADLARVMGYLFEGTIGMCNTYMQELALGKVDNDDPKGKTKTKKKKYVSDPLFQAALKELEVQRLQGFSPHPKMVNLNTLVIQHFAQKLGDDGVETEQTRAMVFVSYREAVDEIVNMLNQQKPMIRAHAFIGQGTDKKGGKGLAQKQQLEVIKKFKAGELNVLVATSIGEEGLDIGEVDLIVCYDASKSAIRMLQRLGRTGRKRDGVVHVLLSELREENNMDRAKTNYKEVQKAIVRGEDLELYGDVKRLLPDHIKPECLEKVMEIQEYVRPEGRKKRAADKEPNAPKGTKRKRNDDPSRNIPAGTIIGFLSASKLRIKDKESGNKRQKTTDNRTLEERGEDDDDDMEIEYGVVGLARRTASAAALTSSAPAKRSSKLRRSATEGHNRKKKSSIVTPSHSQLMAKGVDDDDDMEIERGGILTPVRDAHFNSSSPPPRRRSKSPRPSTDVLVIDSDSDDAPDHSSSARGHSNGASLLSNSPENADADMAWLLDGDDDPDIEIVNSSPVRTGGSRKSPSPAPSDDSACAVVDATSSRAAGKRRATTPIDLVDDSVEFVVPPLPSKQAKQQPVSGSLSRPPAGRKPDMPPPAVPFRSLAAQSPPPPSFPVRAPRNLARRAKALVGPELSPTESPMPSKRRLRRRGSSPDLDPAVHRLKPRSKPNKHLVRYDTEAVHSGDEVSEGSSGSEDEESESDRQFLQEIPETQMSPSYDQSLAYRQSLLTQAPIGGRGPRFTSGPVRKGMYGGGLAESARRRPMVSSSPRGDDSEPDAYALGSFVVDDDEEISFLSSEP